MMIHWTPADGPSLTARCGQAIGGDSNGHTGRYAEAFAADSHRGDMELCPACAHLLETP